ncbi:MAG: exo-alpha-sialidase, partial [Planctomycetes bacterium]|nr:exo-alpha-sialidase [Planctomycetota bacterium]
MASFSALRGPLAGLLLAAVAAAQGQAEPAPGAAAPVGLAVLPADCDLPAAAPHVAVGDDGTALVVFAADEEVWCAVAREGGASFGAPVRVGAAGRLESGLARGPRAAVLPDAMAVLAICGQQGQGRDGDLLAWRSTDGGLTWKGPVRVNDVGDSAREGLFALAAGPGGQLFGTWLDLRAGGAALWCDWSVDGGATWGEDVLAYRSPDGSVCECCAPAAACDPASGDAVALWRNKLGARRDMYARVLRRGA